MDSYAGRGKTKFLAQGEVWAAGPLSAPTREVKVYTAEGGLSARQKDREGTIPAPPKAAPPAHFANWHSVSRIAQDP